MAQPTVTVRSMASLAAIGALLCVATLGYHAGAMAATKAAPMQLNAQVQQPAVASLAASRRQALTRIAGGAVVAAGVTAAGPARAELKECTNPIACGPSAYQPGDAPPVVVPKQVTTAPAEEGGIKLSQAIPLLFFGSLTISFAFTKVREMMEMGQKKEEAAAKSKELLESPDFAKYLQIETLSPGNGKDFPTAGNMVSVHYVGTLLDGTKFDSSRDRGQPLRFPIGVGRVIKGWDAGVMKLSKGEKAKLTIQPEWAYGPRNVGNIPPNSVLVFEVELIDV